MPCGNKYTTYTGLSVHAQQVPKPSTLIPVFCSTRFLYQFPKEPEFADCGAHRSSHKGSRKGSHKHKHHGSRKHRKRYYHRRVKRGKSVHSQQSTRVCEQQYHDPCNNHLLCSKYVPCNRFLYVNNPTKCEGC